MDDDDNLPGPLTNWRGRSTMSQRARGVSGVSRQRGRQERHHSGPHAPRTSHTGHARPYSPHGTGVHSVRRPASQTRYDPRPHHATYVQNIRDPRAIDNQYKNRRFVGFKALEELASSGDNDIIANVNQKRNGFLETIGKDERPDVFVLVLKILSKICKSSFDELKFKLVLDICNTQLIGSLVKYLLELPYPETKSTNSLYWNDQEDFWSNLLTFCDYIITTSPSTAYTKYRSLVEASKSCLNNLKTESKFPSIEVYMAKLVDLTTKLSTHIQKVCNASTSKTANNLNKLHDVLPPDDFRWLNIVPKSVDLSQHVPFLRPNIIEGRYQDVEHYLDVQFRLLREDCFGPIREGVSQYKTDPHKRKYDNIRVFHNVKFVEPYITQGNVGCVVQIELNNKKSKNFAKTKWQYNRRFIFGSLLLFTKDNCRSFMAATVLDRDPRLLAQGKIPVCLLEEVFENLYSCNDTYTMLESDVYFEPYYHVMKALQSRSFGKILPMQQYIVEVQSQHKPPAYLEPDTEFVFNIHAKFTPFLDVTTESVKYCVLDPDTWPTKEEFNFDESQYEAYKHALTHEFAVIQGPPGTGKTYIGLKIAQTLLRNLEKMPGCLMLVICYTNHALDQFLGEILTFTDSVARVGGQSKEKKLDDLNMVKLRSSVRTRKATRDLYVERKSEVEVTANKFNNYLMRLDVLNNGILTCNSIESVQLTLLKQYYANVRGDPLLYWLFESKHEYIASVKDCLSKYEANEEDVDEIKEETNKRKQKMLVGYDDYDLNKLSNLFEDQEYNASFSLRIAEPQLKQLITGYKNATDAREMRNLAVVIQDLCSQIDMYKAMVAYKTQQVNRRINVNTDFRLIPIQERWSLYFQWVEPQINKIKNEMAEIQGALVPAIEAMEEARMVLDLEVLRNRKVIGMTTSGAARLRKLISALAPPIVIIEEAAEVLEQHIITSLTKDTEHVILIGDHQQLRPSASHMKLARHYNLEVSLFERMINNGVHSRRLGVQHRMRPEIAALISPHIYPDLHNHASVMHKPDVRGLHNNLFFFTHDYKEEVQNEWTSSRSNEKEAELTMALANYIILQGYSSEDITILTTYTGQMFYMRKERAKYSRLRDVKITVVDNYQGEESKIILLSLVRNNERGEIGFLGTNNRICVALSRAKEGFYIFGNIDILRKKTELWEKIATTLENNDCVGSSLLLKCQQHPDNTTTINTLEDFEKVPEGGCLLKCDMDLECGHKCLLLCHGYDRDHTTEDTKCRLPCENILCELNHNCPRKCFEECGPCQVLVERTLSCGHGASVPCHTSADNKGVKCLTIVPCTVPACGHQGMKMCFEELLYVECQEPCIYRLECGHSCVMKCHVNDDPDHEKFECKKTCQRRKKGCSVTNDTDLGEHACKKLCHEPCSDCNIKVDKKRSVCKHSYKVACCEDVDAITCRKKCARSLPCGHFCKNLCFEPCGNCPVKVTKIIAECGHKINIECSTEATRSRCKKQCENILHCGHPCKSMCRLPCDALQCTEPSSLQIKAPCGHVVNVPCNLVKSVTEGVKPAEVLLEHCKESCGKELACGHLCRGTCATCYQGRMHVPCQQPCGRQLICGHECTEPCNQICPPCDKPCEVKCAHSTCGKKCGEPCKPCKEPCGRRCGHARCRRLCHSRCSVAPCDEPCARLLPCGHACRGLCAEPCPAACNVCRPDAFPRGLVGEELDDHDKLIELLDCGHILTVDDADGLMNSSLESIYIRKCPMCRKPIINTNRYKDIVNNTLKNEIGPIKNKIYGYAKDISGKKEEVLRKLAEADLPGKIRLNIHLEERFHDLLSLINKQSSVSKKQPSLLDLDMQLLYLNILTLTADCYAKYVKEKSTELKEELNSQILMICSVLDIKKKGWLAVSKISEQQRRDAFNEIKRLNSIVQFASVLSHPKYKDVKQDPKVMQASNDSRDMVFNLSDFNQEKTVASLKNLVKVLNASSQISISEIKTIIKAVRDVPQSGHWFKCPNGHFYAIGECGGAMEVSNCADCGAPVGGSRHTLLSDNVHAREIDGSSFPKWSEQYNNMANFDFD